MKLKFRKLKKKVQKKFRLAVVMVAILLSVFVFVSRQANKFNPEDFSELFDAVESIDVEKSIQDKAFLWDVSGGESYGNAKRLFRSPKNIVIIEADLPPAGKGTQYQAWLFDKDNGKLKKAGFLELSGVLYYLNYETEEDLTPYEKIIVSSELIVDDTIENKILEGEFGKELIIQKDVDKKAS